MHGETLTAEGGGVEITPEVNGHSKGKYCLKPETLRRRANVTAGVPSGQYAVALTVEAL